jgi:hypothetical protein
MTSSLNEQTAAIHQSVADLLAGRGRQDPATIEALIVGTTDLGEAVRKLAADQETRLKEDDTILLDVAQHAELRAEIEGLGGRADWLENIVARLKKRLQIAKDLVSKREEDALIARFGVIVNERAPQLLADFRLHGAALGRACTEMQALGAECVRIKERLRKSGRHQDLDPAPRPGVADHGLVHTIAIIPDPDKPGRFFFTPN